MASLDGLFKKTEASVNNWLEEQMKDPEFRMLMKEEEREFDRTELLLCIIENLLDNRDSLCLQLDFAWGNISEIDLRLAIEPFLKEKQIVDPLKLKENIKVLCESLSRSLDSDTVATMFKCSVDQVEDALR